MPPISLVLCTHQGAAFLDEQLWSLRAQAGVAEIVAVDDASTDATRVILRAHARLDPRLRVYLNPTALGIGANFERAARLARSPWVAFADQDDVWRPWKLARLQAAWDGEASLLHHASRKFSGPAPTPRPAPAGDPRKFSGADLRRLLYRNSVVGHSMLVRADLLAQLMPFPAGVPYDWWIGLGAAALGRVLYLDEHLVDYRIHATNAYHPAGSRARRRHADHALRLQTLAALERWPALPAATREFVRGYRVLLEEASGVRFPWQLWRFYLRQADLLFAGGGAGCSWSRRLRKSFAAALEPRRAAVALAQA